jgi:hypothetical protein
MVRLMCNTAVSFKLSTALFDAGMPAYIVINIWQMRFYFEFLRADYHHSNRNTRGTRCQHANWFDCLNVQLFVLYLIHSEKCLLQSKFLTLFTPIDMTFVFSWDNQIDHNIEKCFRVKACTQNSLICKSKKSAFDVFTNTNHTGPRYFC